MVQIHTPSIPKRLQITPTMVDDFIWDPCLSAYFFLGLKFDWFQRARLKMMWHFPVGIDSSGFTSGKTIVNWAYMQLRCLIIPDHVGVVYYPTFENGKRTFWEYYSRVKTPIFQAHIGRFDEEGEEEGKAKSRGGGCFKLYFRNGSRLEMPAPSLMKDSITQASLRFNTSLFEEFTHIDTMSDAINSQLIGRNTRPSFGNQFHPIWTNHAKFTAPAKTQLHPAYTRVKMVDSEIKKGDPTRFHIRFCYKDFSPGFKDANGKSVRMEKAIREKKLNSTPAEALGEIYGIWGKNTVGWYTEFDILRCVELGKIAKIYPAASRSDDDRRYGPKEIIRYFGGVDPAPAEAKKNDDGAIAVLRLREIAKRPDGSISDNMADYKASWAYVRVLRRASIGEWSGRIHLLHKGFGLSKIVMDLGAGGGGGYIKKELSKDRQEVELGRTVETTPILTLEDVGIRGQFILHGFKRSDPGFERLFGKMAGDDVLIDMAHQEMRTAISKGMIEWMKPFEEWEQEEKLVLGEENIHTIRNVTAAQTQFMNIGVDMEEDKQTYKLTRNGARSFSAIKGRKDIQTAMMNSWMAALIWLRYDAGAGGQQNDDDALGICG